MILVTLGTQSQKFYRLLEAIEQLDTDEEIIVQAGGSADYKSKKMKIFDFISYDEMQKYIDKADLIITHGGTGSIIMPLQKGKKVIASPRLEKYEEHVNDHQKEIVDVFANEKYILKFDDGDDLNKIYQESKKFKPKKYKSNTEKFKESLKSEIDKKEKKKVLLWPFALILFALFLILNFLIPLAGDDWGNAVSGLNSFGEIIDSAVYYFMTHEGRFISRIFVLIFTQDKFLWNILCALLVVIVFILINKIVKNKTNKFILFLTFSFFFLLENEVLKQAVLWLTGNLTYMLPAVLSLIFLYLNKDILDNKFEINNLKFIISLILLALVSMMVEPVSAAMVLGTLLLFIWASIKRKKFDIKRFSYFAVISIGFILMLTSPGAANRLDTMAFSEMGLIEKIITNIPNFINYTYITNSVLILLIALSIALIIKKNNLKFAKTSIALMFTFVIFTILISAYNFAKHYFFINIPILNKLLFLGNSQNILIILIWVVITLLFLYLIIRYIKGNEKIKILFYVIIGYGANIAMLLSPLWGGRTTFFTILMLFIACLLIINYYKFDAFDYKIFKYISIIFIIAWISCTLILYHSVYLQNKDREAAIKEQIQDNSKVIEYTDIPFYALHNPNASTEFHQGTFKKYYGIDEDAELKRITIKYKYNLFYEREGR